jgi:hypothetical protein
MTHGKKICKQLKEVRKRIAEENDIPLEMEECTYKGECRGTCPKCEAEVRYLENALAERLRIGKVATVASLALGLAATTAQAAESIPVLSQSASSVVSESARVSDSIITIQGKVIEEKSGEPWPFVNVRVLEKRKHLVGYKTVATGVTDFDGMFRIKVPQGNYSIEYACYANQWDTIAETHYTADTILAPIRFVYDPTKWESIEIKDQMIGVLDEELFEANPSWQKFEREGVKVIVR